MIELVPKNNRSSSPSIINQNVLKKEDEALDNNNSNSNTNRTNSELLTSNIII
jgi:hypothetical protein